MPLTRTQKILAWGSAGLMATASALGVMFYSPTTLTNSLNKSMNVQASSQYISQWQKDAVSRAKKAGLNYDNKEDALKFAKDNGFTPHTSKYIHEYYTENISEPLNEWIAHNTFDGATYHLENKPNTHVSPTKQVTLPSIGSLNGIKSNNLNIKPRFGDIKHGGKKAVDLTHIVNASGDTYTSHQGINNDVNMSFGEYSTSKGGTLKGSNSTEGSPRHYDGDTYGIMPNGRDYDEFLGAYHTHGEYINEISGSHANNAIRVQSPSRGKTIEVVYPYSAEAYIPGTTNYKKGKPDFLDVHMMVTPETDYGDPSDFSADNWRGHRSIVFSRNLYNGFYYNGYTDLRVAYQFTPSKTKSTSNISKSPLDLSNDWFTFRQINGLAPYYKSTGDGEDAYRNNRTWDFTDFLFNGDINSLSTSDKTGETVEPSPGFNEKAYSYPGQTGLARFISKAVMGNKSSITGLSSVIGGKYDSPYDDYNSHNDSHDELIHLNGNLAEFDAGAGNGYGTVEPITDITNHPVPMCPTCKVPKPQTHTYNPSSKLKKTITGLKSEDASKTQGKLYRQGQKFRYNIYGKIPARTANNTYQQNHYHQDATKTSAGYDYWTTTFTDSGNNDYYKLVDHLPHDVEYNPKKLKVSDPSGNKIPAESIKCTGRRDPHTGKYYGGYIEISLTPKQMAHVTGGAESQAGTVNGKLTSYGPYPHNVHFHVSLPVYADHLPSTKKINSQKGDLTEDQHDSDVNPWNKAWNKQDRDMFSSDSNYDNDNKQGWYDFDNGGSSKDYDGQNLGTYEDYRYTDGDNGTATSSGSSSSHHKHYTSNQTQVSIKRIRASIWHYDYDYSRDDGVEGLHDDDPDENFFPDKDEQDYGLAKSGGSTDSDWIDPDGIKDPTKRDSDTDPKYPYRFNKFFNPNGDDVLKHYYHYGYEDDYYKAPIYDFFKNSNNNEHYRLVYPHHGDSGWTMYDPKTGENGGYVVIPLHASNSDTKFNAYDTQNDSGSSVDSSDDDPGFMQSNYLPYIVPRINLWPNYDNGDEDGRIVVDTDRAIHGLPFRLDMRPLNYLYGDKYKDEFGNAQIQLDVEAKDPATNKDVTVYQATRPLVNGSDALASEGTPHKHDYDHSQLDEWPAGDSSFAHGYDQKNAFESNDTTGTHSNYNLDTSALTNAKSFNGKIPLTFNLSVVPGSNTGRDQIDPVSIHTYGYATTGNNITSKSFGHKIVSGKYGYKEPINSNRTTLVKPERTIRYAGNFDIRELKEKLSATQPRNAVGKTGYGISANDFGLNYRGHLEADNYAKHGTNMQFAFPEVFNSKDSNMTYHADNREADDNTSNTNNDNNVNNTLAKTPYGNPNLLADNLLHVDPTFNSDINHNVTDGSELDTFDDDSKPFKVDKLYDSSSQFPEYLNPGNFTTTYGFYPRATINEDSDGGNNNTDNGNVMLADSDDNGIYQHHSDYDDPSISALSNAYGLKTYNYTNNSNTHTIKTDGQNERMFTPLFLKSGEYPNIFHRAFGNTDSTNDRDHRLGGNFFDIDENRPIKLVGHQYISKNDRPRNQKYDELSLQPILTNPDHGLMQTPISNPAFPTQSSSLKDGWLTDSLWSGMYGSHTSLLK